MSLQVPKQSRIEIKFMGPEIILPHLVGWIRAHEALFYTAYPDRVIHNVYFDTPDLAAYEENLSGTSERSKLRYRWYGLSSWPQAGRVEVKHKRNNYGWKSCYPIEELNFDEQTTWPQFVDDLQAKVPEACKQWLNLMPHVILVNQYHRRYFVSADEAIRITVDTDLKVWDQRYVTHINDQRHSLLLPRHVIVEVKFDRRIRHRVEQTVSNIPLRMSRCSKYVNGIRSIYMY